MDDGLLLLIIKCDEVVYIGGDFNLCPRTTPRRTPSKVPPCPSRFALLTVTHAREGQFDIISNYLKHYTETDCYQ